MRRILCLVLTVLFGIALIRKLCGLEPMSLTVFLSRLSTVDLRFDELLMKVAELGDKLKFPVLENGANILQAIGVFFEWFYKLLRAIVEVPLALIKDVFDFLTSLLNLVKFLFV